MRNSVVFSLALCFAILDLGSTLSCYTCQDSTGSCTDTQDCGSQDSCLSLFVKGGDTIRRCIKNTECDFDQLSVFYPDAQSFTYSCCMSNLCNGAVSMSGGKPVLGLLLSLVGMWWCVQ